MQNFKTDSRSHKLYTSKSNPDYRAATVWKSFGYAFEGIWYVFCTQRNAKIHVAITCLVILMGIMLRLPSVQWAILAIAIGLVLSAEMFNTVIEAIVDLVSPDFHPLAKIAKDTSAGAVMLLAVMGVTVGLFVLGPPLWRFLIGLLLG